ncbi:PQQ-binding-like beta-propeller repeat protein (plasmid) [Haloplanus ruber]
MPSSSRRKFLVATAVTGISGIAGCSRFQSCSPQRTQHETDIDLSEEAQWPAQYYDAANTCYNPSARDPTEGVQVAWRYTLCGPSDDGTIVTPETSYLQNQVIDTQTGESAGEWESDSTPSISDGAAYYPVNDSDMDNPQLRARDSTTGETLWTADLPRGVSLPSPTIEGETVYIAADDLYAMNRETGEERWRFETPSETELTGIPAVREGTAYIFGEDYTLYAVDTETGDEQWQGTPVQSKGSSPIPSVANGLVYIAPSEDKMGEVRALNPTDGSIAWRHEIDSWVFSPLAVTEQSVFAVCGGDRGLVTAIDAETGERQWQQSFEDVPRLVTVAVGSENVYAGSMWASDDAPVYALDQATGEQRWQFNTRPRDFGDYRQMIVNGIAAVDEYVFVTTSGEVYALQEQS